MVRPWRTEPAEPGLHPTDVDRLNAALCRIRNGGHSGLLSDLTTAETSDVERYCRFTHAAVLVFPDDPAAVTSALRRDGLIPRAAIPSTVVRSRLAERHNLDENELDVQIVHGMLDDNETPREVEVFILPMRPGLEEVAADERRHDRESHLAFHITPPDPVIVTGVCTTLAQEWGLIPDGGGYNPHEDPGEGGRTVLYFRSRNDSGTRIELFAAGRHESLLSRHLDGSRRSDPEAERRTILGYASGAWTTQAVRAMAEFGIADHLADKPLDADRLAAVIDTQPDATQRLLRYLTQLGMLTQDPEGYALTSLGALLRRDVTGSARDLALLYGGVFYQSWHELPYSLRTGNEAFAHAFGKPFFDYAATRPDAARVFEKAMAFVSEFAESLPQCYDFGSASTVVDVGGGDGTVMSHILQAHPHLRGVIADLPSTADGAIAHLDAMGVSDRCRLESIDMFDSVPPDADVYVLSRILHDWNDSRAVAILTNCREAMRADGRLLVVERILPAGAPTGLTPAWDLQMLVNTSGGTERTRAQYENLFTAAGMRLTSTVSLPLDMNLMVAAPR